MNFAIVSKNDVVSIKVATTIQKGLIGGGLAYNDKTPDIVCVVGGDGTFISAVQRYVDILEHVLFVGVHTGSGGIFADYTLKQLKGFLADVLNKTPLIEEKRLAYAQVDEKTYYAVNEFRIISNQVKSLNIEINGEKLEEFHGCGLAISTQSGSTAYNKSIGGAIISPDLETLQLNEIAGIQTEKYHSVSNPIVFGANNVISITSNSFANTKFMYDRWSAELEGDETIKIGMSNKKLKIAHYFPKQWVKNLNNLY